jgi:hypothetical protein
MQLYSAIFVQSMQKVTQVALKLQIGQLAIMG